jgi:hypothetical protein
MGKTKKQKTTDKIKKQNAIDKIKRIIRKRICTIIQQHKLQKGGQPKGLDTLFQYIQKFFDAIWELLTMPFASRTDAPIPKSNAPTPKSNTPTPKSNTPTPKSNVGDVSSVSGIKQIIVDAKLNKGDVLDATKEIFRTVLNEIKTHGIRVEKEKPKQNSVENRPTMAADAAIYKMTQAKNIAKRQASNRILQPTILEGSKENNTTTKSKTKTNTNSKTKSNTNSKTKTNTNSKTKKNVKEMIQEIESILKNNESSHNRRPKHTIKNGK